MMFSFSALTTGPQSAEIETVNFLNDLEKSLEKLLQKYPYYSIQVMLKIYKGFPQNIKDDLVRKMVDLLNARRTQIYIHK